MRLEAKLSGYRISQWGLQKLPDYAKAGVLVRVELAPDCSLFEEASAKSDAAATQAQPVPHLQAPSAPVCAPAEQRSGFDNGARPRFSRVVGGLEGYGSLQASCQPRR